MTQASFALKVHNPDVLTCIANLSNDEVLTPPEFANQMLDTLQQSWASSNNGQNIWSNKEVTFLDPCTKSGVFLREIVKRLSDGLTKEIPDLTERINHILTKQVFGIGITQLTSLLARRSVYCSKNAKGIHSVARTFDKSEGNIWFERTEHTWVTGKCKYCGASKSEYARSQELETHAYAFIHTNDLKARMCELFGENMQFDVIIGNPPYQLSTEGAGGQARPIYQLFIQQAMNLEPRYLLMVTPSRWFSGGMGLDAFRSEMLKEKRLKVLVDFIQEKDAFPNVNINGGVNYFLWERDHDGDCTVTTVGIGGRAGAPINRSLDEFDIFIRQNEAVRILRKVLASNHESFSKRISAIDPFKLPTTFHGVEKPTPKRDIKLYGSGRISYISREEVNANQQWIDKWKVLIPQASDGNENYPLPIWNQTGPFIAKAGEACTFTYLIASMAKSKSEATYIVDYMRTKFFRFMVSLRKATQHNKADNFRYVPELDMDRTWDDKALYKYFSLNKDEIEYIESMIREMKFGDE